MKRFILYILLSFVSLSFLSCAGLSKKIFNISDHEKSPVFTSEAYTLFLVLNEKNNGIKTFKGTGRMNLSKTNGEVISADIAWVAQNKSKIYIAIRNVIGQPLAGIATDGQHVYFASHMENKFYKKRQDNDDLEKFTSIPINIKDTILLLSGRAPLCNFTTASKDYIEDKGPVLVLKNGKTDIVEKVYFDDDKNILQIDMLDSGDLLYRVFFDKEIIVKKYHIYSKLIILNKDGDYFKLDINRYWADEPVSPSVFVLKPPD